MTVRKPQLFCSADVSQIEQYISDTNWAFEQKVDGMRMIVVMKPGSVEFLTREGRPLKNSGAKLQFGMIERALKPLNKEYGPQYEIVIDGELMPDQHVYVIFDVPYFSAGAGSVHITSDMPNHIRAGVVKLLIDKLESSNIKSIARAESVDEKRKLYSVVLKRGCEGLIAKRLDSPYTEGKRVKHSVKLKFTKTADVIVYAKNVGDSKHSIRGGTKINYMLGVYNKEGEMMRIGSCSANGKEAVDAGEVIEVEYLYMGAGGKLVQPRMLKRRADKLAQDAKVDQLTFMSKNVL